MKNRFISTVWGLFFFIFILPVFSQENEFTSQDSIDFYFAEAASSDTQPIESIEQKEAFEAKRLINNAMDERLSLNGKLPGMTNLSKNGILSFDIEILGLDLEQRIVEVRILETKTQKILQNYYYKAEKNSDGLWRLRVFEGNYSSESLVHILFKNAKNQADVRTQVNGVEIGRVLYKNFQDWPLDIIASFGISTHEENGLQENFQAGTFGIRLEWKSFPWSDSIKTKLHILEGMNFASRVPYYEGIESREDNSGRVSKRLNFLGIGMGISIGDLIGSKKYENCYIGGYLYHRSGIFGTVDYFNNVSGGSNFKTYYVECEY